MKIVNVKAMVAKVFTVGLLAGAFAIAAPKADAQVAFGVRVGPVAVYHPAYRAPVYVGPAYPYGYGYGFRPGFYGRPYGWDHDRHFYGREREDFRRR
jgi:hypothetical protein